VLGRDDSFAVHGDKRVLFNFGAANVDELFVPT
jgi:hypothetical protein